MKNSFYNKYLGLTCVLSAAVLWGTTGTIASFSPTLSPLTIGAAAMGGGGLLQTILARKAIKDHFHEIKSHFFILIIGILAVFVYPLAFYSSMHLAGITIGTVISMGTAPLFTALLEKIFENKKLSLRWFISFILGAIGILCLSLGESQQTHISNHFSEEEKLGGLLLGIIAGLAYALFSWIAKRLIDRNISSKAIMGSMFGGASILLLPICIFSSSTIFIHPMNIFVIGYMILIPMFLGYVLFGYGLKTITASQALTLTLFEPVVAALLAITLVGEKLELIGWIGMILIMICLILLSKKPQE
ncbi:DMT family transporter [Acinetobacter nectaris]|uniref:DMT family transporter n=1 Tax=Acinetobacter nectaris TaxID=1219382 RepID=UPI001EFF65FA|nr:EamA family transporter [Acinetobacter nectaris]MCF9033306.1 EamA family transporter [Acinetobacter nectaris]